MAVDRLAPGYEPDWDIDYAVGHQAELFVADLIASLEGGRVEVKRDAKAAATGNIYVEFKCRRGGHFVPSGIATTTADAFAYVLGEGVVVFATTAVLRSACRRAYREGRIKDGGQRGSHPTVGVLVPVNELLNRLMDAA